MNIKRLRLPILITISLFLIGTSCSSDDDSDSLPKNSQSIETEILGVWRLVEYASTSSIAESETTLTETGSEFNYTLEFINNPKLIHTNGSYAVNVNETRQDQTSSFTYVVNSNENQQEGVHIGEWSINSGNLITRIYDLEPDEPGSYQLTSKILELTKNRLILKIDNSSSSSENHTVTGSSTLTYIR